MVLASSKVTAQGQISVPAEVRRRLGVGPGSVLEWDEDEGQIVVKRKGRYSSEELHAALFSREVEPKTVEQMKAGIRGLLAKKHARD
ncbi:MAG: AbrB/MazE/SpoVT family DNA-binding domain-containing protein [Deltaproteobacteria bacterium]|nr:AbrB/MazE/SpoVT family DNA-binding domain-containing protein [Deltaproteobacteria bacterium]